MSLDAGQKTRTTAATFTRGGRAEEANRLPVSTVFDVLSDERRRHLLYYLIDVADGEAKPTDIAEYLCSVETAVETAEPESVLVDLHHRHLPKMEVADLIEYHGWGEPISYLRDPLLEECLATAAARDFGGQR